VTWPELPAGLPVTLAISAAVVVLLMAVTFTISVARDRHDTLDVAWGLGFALIAGTTFVLSSGEGDGTTRAFVTVLTVVWGVRLAVHIGVRNRGEPEDHRYAAMRRRATGNPHLHVLVRAYLAQAVVLWLVSLPVQVAQHGTGVHPVVIAAGTALWSVGMVFEAVGDWQLRRFRADPGNRGRVLDRGLWRYTRHPNYFGDACVWWGLFLLACSSWYGLMTIVSPVLMTFLLARGTGKPMIEEHLRRRRPAYADYVERTSGFFPLPPRRSTRPSGYPSFDRKGHDGRA
jgi:steroid 5-alpha reductase family enzyme